MNMKMENIKNKVQQKIKILIKL